MSYSIRQGAGDLGDLTAWIPMRKNLCTRHGLSSHECRKYVTTQRMSVNVATLGCLHGLTSKVTTTMTSADNHHF